MLCRQCGLEKPDDEVKLGTCDHCYKFGPPKNAIETGPSAHELELRGRMRKLILDLKRDGRSVIFSTHIMEQAEQICDFIFLINKGRKVIDGPLAEVRRSADQAIRIDYDGDGAVLAGLPGVRRINDAGKTVELFLEPGRDPQDLLERLVGRLRIRRFDLREPSLHEVFVRAVGGKSDE